MYIQLKKGLFSYSYKGYIATRTKPLIEVPTEVGAYLLSTGRFTAIQGVSDKVQKDENPTLTTSDLTQQDTTASETHMSEIPDISSMKVEELNMLAESLGVEFPENAKKPERIEILTNFLNKKGEE